MRLPPPVDTVLDVLALEDTGSEERVRLEALLSAEDALVAATELLVCVRDEEAAILLAELSTLLLEVGVADILTALLDTGDKLLFWLLPLKLAALPPPPPQAQRPATKLLANNMRAIGIVFSIMLRSC